MARALSWWHQLQNDLMNISPAQLKAVKRLYRIRGRSGRTFLVLTIVVVMLICNWRLMMATGSGFLVMFFVYLLQAGNYSLPTAKLREVFTGPNRLLITTLASGSVAALSSYLALTIWSVSQHPWIATGALLQGLATLAVIVLLVWQLSEGNSSQDEAKRNELLMNLTDEEPLKRLIAVRQLSQELKKNKTNQSIKKNTVECFQLMMASETEPVVREAILEGLQAISYNRKISKLDTSHWLAAETLEPLTIKNRPVKISPLNEVSISLPEKQRNHFES